MKRRKFVRNFSGLLAGLSSLGSFNFWRKLAGQKSKPLPELPFERDPENLHNEFAIQWETLKVEPRGDLLIYHYKHRRSGILGRKVWKADGDPNNIALVKIEDTTFISNESTTFI